MKTLYLLLFTLLLVVSCKPPTNEEKLQKVVATYWEIDDPNSILITILDTLPIKVFEENLIQLEVSSNRLDSIIGSIKVDIETLKETPENEETNKQIEVEENLYRYYKDIIRDVDKRKESISTITKNKDVKSVFVTEHSIGQRFMVTFISNDLEALSIPRFSSETIWFDVPDIYERIMED